MIEKAEGKGYDRSNFPGGSAGNYSSGGGGGGAARGGSMIDKYSKGDSTLGGGDLGRGYVENSSVRAYLKSLESKIDVAKAEEKKEVPTASSIKGNTQNEMKQPQQQVKDARSQAQPVNQAQTEPSKKGR